MSTTSPPQLFLLADHIKLALLERQRALSLSLPSTSQDSQIARSLAQLRSGIEALTSQVADAPDDDTIAPQLPRLRSTLDELTAQFGGDEGVAGTTATSTVPPPRKSVRFSDNPDSDETEDPNRAALFPYRDEPGAGEDGAAADVHVGHSNQQIHAYHDRVMREQDDALDALGLSIGRQRELSMQIGDELDGQVMLLDEVEEGVDRHSAQFRRARGRLERFERKAKENWSLVVIVILIIILLLLIVITK